MRLYFAELKRQIHTRSVRILIPAVFLFTLLLSWLPVSFVKYSCLPASGQAQLSTSDSLLPQGADNADTGAVVTVKGIKAIRMRRALWKDYTGSAAPELFALALEQYQESLAVYGEDGIFTDEMPANDYYEKIDPIAKLIFRLREVYGNPKTGESADIRTLTAQDARNFYSQYLKWLDSYTAAEQRSHPSAAAQARILYQNVKTPFCYDPGASSTVLDYLVFLIFILVIAGVLIAAPVFSAEFQTGADELLRCAKHGMRRLVSARIKAALSISAILYVVCTAIFLVIENTIFGWETCSTSAQLMFSAACFLPLNMGQLQLLTAAAGLLSLTASVCLVLLLSCRMDTTFSSAASALLLCFLPSLLPALLPGNAGTWLRCFLPSGGVVPTNSIFYELIDTNFVHAGPFSFWIPFVILGACMAEIPIWYKLTFRSYISR